MRPPQSLETRIEEMLGEIEGLIDALVLESRRDYSDIPEATLRALVTRGDHCRCATILRLAQEKAE
jgi:hypothetical protein